MSVNFTRSESTAIKGLLIFLIILGHNAVLTDSIPNLFSYLYSFHVASFFIIPFFYESKKRGFKASIEVNFIRLYYPYVIFFLLLSGLFYFLDVVDPNPVDLGQGEGVLLFLNSLFSGSYFLIDKYTGFQFLWFLPVLFSMMVWKDFLGRYEKLRTIFLVIGFLSFILYMVLMYSKILLDFRYKSMLFSPFALFQGLGAWFLGYTCKALYDSRLSGLLQKISFLLFVIISVYYFLFSSGSNTVLVMRCLMPYLFFGVLLYARSVIGKIRIFECLGKYTFPIYIISSLLCSVSYLLCKKVSLINIPMGIFLQILLTFFSLGMAYILYEYLPMFRKFIFPRSSRDLLGK